MAWVVSLAGSTGRTSSTTGTSTIGTTRIIIRLLALGILLAALASGLVTILAGFPFCCLYGIVAHLSEGFDDIASNEHEDEDDENDDKGYEAEESFKHRSRDKLVKIGRVGLLFGYMVADSRQYHVPRDDSRQSADTQKEQ